MRYLLLVIVAVGYFAYVSAESCVQCNSGTDPRCATNPDQFMSKECANATSKCYTRVLNGQTLRGCASDLDNVTASKCNNEMECLICTFMEGCNRQVFPLNRAKCVQCSGNSTNSTCATNSYATAQPCPIYKFGDKCFIRNTHRNGTEGSFQRGCLSTALTQKICVKEENCYTCEGVACNFLGPNDPQIPHAADSASILFSSFILLVTGAFIVRQV